MRSSKTYLLLLFVATTVAGAVVAWRQHLELIELRAAVLAQNIAAATPPSSPSPHLPPATAAQPEEPFAASEPAPLMPDPEPAAANVPEVPRPDRRGPSRAAIMENPTVQRLMMIQRKASLDNRYAALFKSLNLPPDQLERFKELLVERMNARSDVMSAARSEGLNFREDREAINALVRDNEAEVEAAMRQSLGESVYSQWKDYERTMPQRTTVDRLEQRLSYTSTPLSREQAATVLQILDRSNAAPGNSPLGAIVNDTAIEQARGVLAAPQLDALRQLQEEQQVQSEINAAMRRQFDRNRANSRSTNPPNSGAGG